MCILVEGEAGIGKSALAKAIAEAARARQVGRVIGPLRSGMAGCLSAQELVAALEESAQGPAPRSAMVMDDLCRALCRAAQSQPLLVIVDDAHLAEDVVLDGLESALLAIPQAPLCVVCVATPELRRARALWGRRLSRFRTLALHQLAPAAARALLRELLKPAEYVPADAIERLCQAANAVPGALVQLAAAIHRAGMVQARPGTASYYLATRELERLRVSDLWQWAITRELEALEPAFADGAKVVALLGGVVEQAALKQIQAMLAEDGAPLAADGGALLEALTNAGLLRQVAENPRAYAFESATMAETIASLLPDRDRMRIHRIALAYQRSRAEPDLASVARHARALGEKALAAAAERTLAERAGRDQRLVDAEAHYSNAVDLSSEPGDTIALLVGRARTRSHLYRLADAAEDLRAASELARAVADRRLEATASFELATVLDWMHDYATSARFADVGIELASAANDRVLLAGAAVAEGRTAWRRGAVEEAIAALSRGAHLAAEVGDADSRAIALLLLGCALVQAKRSNEAEACLGEAIEDAARRCDRLHLCAGLGNRAFLWAEQGNVERCIDDLTRAVRVARELGHPGTERTALFNLSEVLYWAGREDEASVHLGQARVLEERFISRPIHSSVLLCARLAASRQDYGSAVEHLEWLTARNLPDTNVHNAVAFVAALRHVMTASRGGTGLAGSLPLSWEEILRLAETLLDEERLELRYWRAHYDLLAGLESTSDTLGARRELLSHPVWGPRLTRLTRQHARAELES